MNNDALHLVLVQDNPIVGDIDGNTEIALDVLNRNPAADLVVFSECFISGYPLQDLVLRPGFLSKVEAGIERLRQAVVDLQGPAVLIGAPVARTTLPGNAALLIDVDGSIRTVMKTELPNNDVFDERRVFASAEGTRPAPLSFRGFQLGVQICEDMWHGRVSRGLADELADVLLVINGSPYQRGKHEVRLRHARARSNETGLPLIYVNQYGGQDELVFDGGSFAYNPDPHSAHGSLLQGPAFDRAELKVVLKRDQLGQTTIGFEGGERALYPEDRIETDYKACVLGLRDYLGKTGMKRVVLGVSGGLDSALVATMAADAIGSENVIGVMMPSPYTSKESIDLATDLMNRLDIHQRTISIEDAFSVVDDAMTDFCEELAPEVGAKPDLDLARENFQARLRGLKLMGITNAIPGTILLSTGNKSEMSVGYATLYGDMSGGFNPLKSVWKTDAFAMARWRNAFEGFDLFEPIPDEIIDRRPTAELAEGQEDANTLGDYEALDFVLRILVEEFGSSKVAATRLEKKFGDDLPRLTGGVDAQTYSDRIAGLLRRAQYKRMQAPPGVKTNATDFGAGWRYPTAGTYSF
ncbi:NAD+ synthase [Salipiger sp. PrR003]|uniref:NAD+ synthase n=1 Tax=Salipiger sp. PrR003 TaxID=2706776 RepID=UPI0013DA7A55|nr:NAD+ synthase [Salipiger sp. PrR003]NDV53074.1 NAD+ synthase [Salipiger sp. PrR003]